MRGEIEESKWFHSRLFEDVEVAIAVGHAADFWELPEDIQALLVARFRVKGVRDAYEDKMHKDEMRVKNKNRHGRPPTR